MAEMWTRSPIMQGNTEQHQLTLISQLCGSITPEVRARVGMSCEEQSVGRVWDWAPKPLPCPVCWLLCAPSNGVCLLPGRLEYLLACVLRQTP